MKNVIKQDATFMENWSPVSLNSYNDFSSSEFVPSFYVIWPNEATDEDIRRYIPHSSAFQFLSDPQEDIYTLEDGEEICL